MARREAYRWLAHVMGLPEPKAHMSRMRGRERLQRVVAICDGLMGSTEVDEDFSTPPPAIPTGRG